MNGSGVGVTMTMPMTWDIRIMIEHAKYHFAFNRRGILPDLASDWIVIDPGYVIFDRERQRVMREVVPALERYGVQLIGRYGAWTYSYMERALLDGLEVAERVGQGMGHGL